MRNYRHLLRNLMATGAIAGFSLPTVCFAQEAELMSQLAALRGETLSPRSQQIPSQVQTQQEAKIQALEAEIARLKEQLKSQESPQMKAQQESQIRTLNAEVNGMRGTSASAMGTQATNTSGGQAAPSSSAAGGPPGKAPDLRVPPGKAPNLRGVTKSFTGRGAGKSPGATAGESPGATAGESPRAAAVVAEIKGIYSNGRITVTQETAKGTTKKMYTAAPDNVTAKGPDGKPLALMNGDEVEFKSTQIREAASSHAAFPYLSGEVTIIKAVPRSAAASPATQQSSEKSKAPPLPRGLIKARISNRSGDKNRPTFTIKEGAYTYVVSAGTKIFEPNGLELKHDTLQVGDTVEFKVNPMALPQKLGQDWRITLDSLTLLEKAPVTTQEARPAGWLKSQIKKGQSPAATGAGAGAAAGSPPSTPKKTKITGTQTGVVEMQGNVKGIKVGDQFYSIAATARVVEGDRPASPGLLTPGKSVTFSGNNISADGRSILGEINIAGN